MYRQQNILYIWKELLNGRHLWVAALWELLLNQIGYCRSDYVFSLQVHLSPVHLFAVWAAFTWNQDDNNSAWFSQQEEQ